MNSLHLSETFLEKMKQLLGDGYEDYLACYEEEPFYGLRVNTLKVTPEDFAAEAKKEGWELTPVPWISNGFYYPGELRPARHPWYYAGLYYLQEPSAMTPASLLPVESGEKVLDLCAAPGGKSTELAAKLKGTGLLFSNDISNSRAKALLKNLELFGAGNICVSSETPEKLSESFAEFFDKILVDAPCSGEGMFRRDPDMVKSYEEKGPDYYAPVQREIVTAAVRMLAPGGMLLYSTCTFDEDEDEGTIRYLLETFPEMHLVPLERKEGFAPGIGMPECVRLFPHKIKGEGHFIALLQKEGRSLCSGAAASRMKETDAQSMEPVFDFLKQLPGDWEADRFHMVKEQIYYLPESLAGEEKGRLKGIRCLRTGLLLGEVLKGRFEPSQALAMALKPEEYPCVLTLSPADERSIRYLKGETLQLKEEEAEMLQRALTGAAGSGESAAGCREQRKKEKKKDKKDRAGGTASWCLVCVDGQPLGWAKLQNQSLKNKYYPGWRWQ